MSSRTKKFLWYVAIAFFVFMLFTRPEKAADVVAGAGGVAYQGFESILVFFDALLERT